MDLTARQLNAGDAPAWRMLRIEALRDHPAAVLATTEEVLAIPEAELAMRLERGQSYGLFQDTEMIGMAALIQPGFARARHRGEIGGVYLRPAARGTGAADRMMDLLIQAATERGIWQLELFVNTGNPRAIRFYERHGFTRQGHVPNAIISTDGPEHDWFYTRDLRPDPAPGL